MCSGRWTGFVEKVRRCEARAFLGLSGHSKKSTLSVCLQSGGDGVWTTMARHRRIDIICDESRRNGINCCSHGMMNWIMVFTSRNGDGLGSDFSGAWKEKCVYIGNFGELSQTARNRESTQLPSRRIPKLFMVMYVRHAESCSITSWFYL